MVKQAGLCSFKRTLIFFVVLLFGVLIVSRLVRRPPSALSYLKKSPVEELNTSEPAVVLVEKLNVSSPPLAHVEELPGCCLTAAERKIEDLCLLNVSEKCSCTDYMLCKLVVVTALSSNHFIESQDFFGSVLAKLPTSMIIVYDIGLTMNQVNRVQSYCNVLEVRKFNFTLYPPHTKNLYTYAWKPFIAQEVSNECELFFYCDASCRVKDSFVTHLHDLLRFPLLSISRLRSSGLRTTHDGMLKYLAPNFDRVWLMDALPIGFAATGIVFLVNDFLKDKFLKHWVDCAQHEECIAPEGAKLLPCDFSKRLYAGCHRYDQSALNVILLREFGPSLQKIFDDNSLQLVKIRRQPTDFYDNSESKHCGIQVAS